MDLGDTVPIWKVRLLYTECPPGWADLVSTSDLYRQRFSGEHLGPKQLGACTGFYDTLCQIAQSASPVQRAVNILNNPV